MSNSAPEPKQFPQAFLVVDGKRVILLNQPVTNLGRKKENHVVIADEHVSRYHAQIRRIRGRYLLLDMKSTVGTSVNGKKVDQTFLKPGDVISLGGIPVIFGMGSPELTVENLGTGPHGVPTGPTDSTDLNAADSYLDLFETPEDE